jgi:hypothetical protein
MLPYSGIQRRVVAARKFLARLNFTLKMEAIISAETSVHIRTTRHNMPEDGSIDNYHCEDLKSYK